MAEAPQPDRRQEFEAWYRLEHPRIVASLSVACRNRDLAGEVAAEAFVRAYERWDRVRLMERPGGWLYRTAFNLLKRRARRRAQESELLSRLVETPATEAAHRDLDLWRAVETLPDRMRAVVAMRFVGDLTEPEIAKALGVSRGTVATQLHRAKRQLGSALAIDDPPSETPRHEETSYASR